MILTINPGSSSLKYKLFDDIAKEVILDEDIVIDEASVKNHTEASDKMFEKIGTRIDSVKKIGVRVVHGGPKYNKPTIIDSDVLSEIKKYSKFAPIHNPLSIEIVELISKKNLEGVSLFAIFDTGYFSSMPEENYFYALPDIEDEIKIRRYGFHGISHKYAQSVVDPENQKRVLSVHLGAGCSITAIDRGNVVKTSMGMTPMEGLIMQTRSGDLDPGILIYLVEKYGIKEAYELIKKKSGLAGLTKTDGAMINVLYAAEEEITGTDVLPNFPIDDNTKKMAKLALKMYVNKIKEYIGAYTALMNGVDVIAFTGKIGFNSPVIRNKVMADLNFLGDVEVVVVKPDEELAMTREIQELRNYQC